MGMTLKELAIHYAKKQPQQADSLTVEAPILGVIPFEEASHGLWNMYEDVEEVQGAGWVEMNAPLPAAEVVSSLKKVDLSILGGEIECPEDTAVLFGGKEKYFTKKMDKVIRKSGMSAETRIIYDNFRAYSIEHQTTISAGGTGGTYSIIAVHFVPDETCGLYSPNCFKQGTLLQVDPINGGNLYKATTGRHAGVLVYGVRFKSYVGLQIANKNSVASLVNISSAKKPTAAMVDDLLATVRAKQGATYLFMHEKAKNMLQEFKNSSLQITPGGKDFNRQITHWNGIEIVTSYNFKDGTEEAV